MTKFGEAVVLLPLIAVMLFWLALFQTQKAAVWWVLSAALCAVLTGILKLGFYACPGVLDLGNPSGHTSLSTLVYGGITFVAATESRGAFRFITVGSGAGFIIVISASRLLLRVHSIPEIGLGIMIGTFTLLLFTRSYLRCRTKSISLIPLLLISGVLVLGMYGRRILDTDTFLRHTADYFRYYCN
jgi:membrane-associated phospholipid phosphatase